MLANPISPEERTKSLMRGVRSEPIDPNFGSSSYQLPEPQLPQEQLGVGTNAPQLAQEAPQDNNDMVSSFKEWLGGLTDKFGISQQFGNKSSMYKSGSHPGLDIRTPTGTQLTAPVGGQVSTGYDPNGWGRYVQITTPSGEVIQFSHLTDTSDLIKQISAMKNKLIKKGEIIGTTGGGANDPNRGLSTGSHLDVSVKRGGKFINPLSLNS